MTGTPPTPLDHRARRRILRRLHESGRLYTAAELSTDLALRLSEALYHLRVLVAHDTVEEKSQEDEAKPRFESKIFGNREIIKILASTKAKDETE